MGIAETNTRSALDDVKIAGTGSQWKGWGSKAKHVSSTLQTVDPDRIVAVVDSRDVLLNNLDEKSLKKFVEDFKSLTANKEHAIVVGAESQCCVSALTHAKPGDFLNDDLSRTGKKETCNSGKGDCLHKGNVFEQPWKDAMHKIANDEGAKTSKNVYLNTGIIIGKAKDILSAYATLNMKEAEDDRALFTELLLKKPELIALDYEQKLIGNNAWSEGMDGCVFDWDAEMQKFKHPEFESFMNVTGSSHVSLATLVTCVENLLMLLREITTTHQVLRSGVPQLPSYFHLQHCYLLDIYSNNVETLNL